MRLSEDLNSPVRTWKMNSHSPKLSTSLTIMGIALMIFGALAIATPAVAGEAVVYVIGTLMLVNGIFQIYSGMRAEGWTHKLPPVILGAITLLAGLGVIGHPLLGLSFLTLLLTGFFIAEGIWKIVSSFSYRPSSGWLALCFSGIVTLALGVLIWREWPLSGLWAVGTLVGVDFLTTGISVLVLGSTLRAVRHGVEEKVAEIKEKVLSAEEPL